MKKNFVERGVDISGLLTTSEASSGVAPIAVSEDGYRASKSLIVVI